MDVVLMQSEEGDWQGLYINGELEVEDHSLSPSQVLDALGIPHTAVSKDLSDTGRCPLRLVEQK